MSQPPASDNPPFAHSLWKAGKNRDNSGESLHFINKWRKDNELFRATARRKGEGHDS